MRKAPADWRASEVEIVDGTYVHPQFGEAAKRDQIIEMIAWLMDRSIPIGGYRIGLDPIIGLIPGFGDVFGTLVSAVLIVQAQRAGVPKATVLRMMANVGIDTLLGSVPFVGDAFDFAWTANSKNLELYRASMRGRRENARDYGFLVLLLLGLVILLSIPIALGIWAFRALSN